MTDDGAGACASNPPNRAPRSAWEESDWQPAAHNATTNKIHPKVRWNARLIGDLREIAPLKLPLSAILSAKSALPQHNWSSLRNADYRKKRPQKASDLPSPRHLYQINFRKTPS